MQRPSRIAVLYNTDYDAEAKLAGIDVSSVEASARSIASALSDNGYRIELVGVHGLDVFDVLAKIRASAPDLVFNLCESMEGDARNEPTFAGLLDLYGIPYTGADLLGLASCLHKQRTKDILIARGISTPPYRCLETTAQLADPSLEALDYPWFLKLAHEDASVGITEENHVTSAAALRARTQAMFDEFHQPVIAERYVEGREINVTLIGNGDTLRMLPLHEIDFAEMPKDRPRIVSYAAKWDETHVDYVGTKPVPLRDASPALIAAVEAIARAAHAAVGLRDYGRVDLRVDADGTPWVIDVNPNCDISPDAGVARSALVAGLSYAQLIDLITISAWRRIRG
ncbi:MAG: ATP-grasp domain-containing protein [Deltaproteobacteria bacterium]|nr:ATP-grasp domain-containing protein [Deltaproteobacteria bacterium]MDQ3300836.1 ATP-grasp domain-containing protein [Myxococcota bacterium]